jgi:hypothetical protein
MTSTVAGFTIAAIPFLAVAALLWLADLIQRRARVRIARQVALTDAIHGALGAVAAPTLRRRFGRGWRVTIAVPLGRPHTIAAVIRIIDRAWTGLASAPIEIVLLRRADPRGHAPGVRSAARGSVPLRAAG